MNNRYLEIMADEHLQAEVVALRTTVNTLTEVLGALYAWEFEETDSLLTSWKERFPNIAWTKREVKLAAQAALRRYEEVA